MATRHQAPSFQAPAAAGKARHATPFRVVLGAGRGKPALSLTATDASSALILAQRHGKGRRAELWRGDKLVCLIAEDTFAGFWEIGRSSRKGGDLVGLDPPFRRGPAFAGAH